MSDYMPDELSDHLTSSDSDDIDLSGFVTQEQQAAAIAAANAPRRRKKRAGQLLPPSNSRGRQRVRRHGTQQDTFEPADVEAWEATEPASTSSWAHRQQKAQQLWQEKLETNIQLCQQHHANAAAAIAEHAVAAALRGAIAAMVAALLRHSCCGAHDDEARHELTQQLTDQIEAQVEVRLAQPQSTAPLGPISICSMRLVACHMMGTSFWLPVPTVKCSCCSSEPWEVQAAAAGFFGSSPVQPGVWFSTQLLDAYTPMCVGSGTSATSFATAMNSVAHKPNDVPSLSRLATKLGHKPHH